MTRMAFAVVVALALSACAGSGGPTPEDNLSRYLAACDRAQDELRREKCYDLALLFYRDELAAERGTARDFWRGLGFGAAGAAGAVGAQRTAPPTGAVSIMGEKPDRLCSGGVGVNCRE